MELAFLVYFISLLDSMTGVFFALAFTSVVLAFAYVLTASDYHSKYTVGCISKDQVELFKTKTARAWMWSKIWMGMSVAFFMFANVIPSQKTAYMMVSAYAAQKVAENPKTIELSSKVIKIIEANLDRYVDEAFEEAKKGATPKSKN